MSISSIHLVKERVMKATAKSKIAVFTNCRGGTRELDAVFDSTFVTRKRVQGDDSYIGSYDSSMDIDEMMVELRESLRG